MKLGKRLDSAFSTLLYNTMIRTIGVERMSKCNGVLHHPADRMWDNIAIVIPDCEVIFHELE